jgi:uncharacterized protein YabE (DUF348 family)
MRFLSNKFINHIKAAHLFGRSHVRRRPYIVPILGLLAGIAIVGGVVVSRPSAALRPSDSHVVFLSDNGTRQTLDTKSKTVGELVGKLPLHLIPQDVVEPSLDTKIVQDNFRINIYRARPVTVDDQGVKTVTITAQKSPRVVAQGAGLTVYPEDNISFAPGSIKENIIGEKVIVDPATPVHFNLYGTSLTVRTHSKTVADLLDEKNVKLAKSDTLKPAADTPIKNGLKVFVIRNGTTVQTKQQTIPAPVETISDPNLTLGSEAVRQAGAPGIEVITYRVVTKNGEVVSRKAIQKVVVSKPVPRIVVRGTNIDIAGNKTSLMAAAGIAPGDYGYADFIVSHESNWNPLAQNASGAYGLCQALPGGKMASAGSDWQDNPVTQLRWCSGYATGVYGSWYGAYNHWVAYRWW